MKTLLSLAGLTFALCACAQTTPDTNEPVAKRAAMEWTATETSIDENGTPQVALVLQVVGSTDEIFRTTCTGTTSTEMQDMEGSVASIQCWWAGGGDQYGVFVGDAEKLSIRHRTVDEEAGFGAWEELESL